MNSNSRRTTDDATLNLSPADVHELGIERITRSLACTYIDTAISKLQSSDAGGGVLLEGGVIAQEEKSSALKNPLNSCRIAGKEASRYSRDFDKFSTLAKSGRKIAQLKWSDFEIGQLLGTGAFCHVYEVTLQKGLSVQESGLVKSGSRDVGDVLKKSGIDKGGANEKNKGGPPIKFALKHLDPDCLRGNQDFSDSAIDLVMEAKILSCLQHPNLVRLHAVTGGSISKVFAKGGYFLLLDRLHGSLSQKMKEWAAAEGNSSAHDKVQRQEHRLKCTALGVARGMGYLHSNRVIYR
jgi:serine/threonine protein kinase